MREALTALGEREEQAARRVPRAQSDPKHLVRSLQTRQEPSQSP